MTVFDASVLVDALVTVGPPGSAARAALRDVHTLEVPAIFPAEAMSALRSMTLRGELGLARARAAARQVRSVRTIQHAFEPFAERVWELRDNLTVYDAWYVALAERLDSTLVTTDDRLLTAVGPRCPVRRP